VVDGAQGGADAQVTGDDFQLAERALENFGGLQGDVAVRRTVEAVAADAVLLVKVVGQAVEVGVGRQGLVEGGVEDRHVGHVGQLLMAMRMPATFTGLCRGANTERAIRSRQ
jgi:hypothetical protein